MKDGFVCIIHMKLFTMLSNVCHMIIGDLFETSHSNINSLHRIGYVWIFQTYITYYNVNHKHRQLFFDKVCQPLPLIMRSIIKSSHL